MKIQIYGTGGAKFQELAQNVTILIHQFGIEAEIEKITDSQALMHAGISVTPALGINGKILSYGKVLSPEEIAEFLKLENSEISSTSCNCFGGEESKAKPCCSSQENSHLHSEAHEHCCGGCCCHHERPLNYKGISMKRIFLIILFIFIVASIVFVILLKINGNPA